MRWERTPAIKDLQKNTGRSILDASHLVKQDLIETQIVIIPTFTLCPMPYLNKWLEVIVFDLENLWCAQHCEEDLIEVDILFPFF